MIVTLLGVERKILRALDRLDELHSAALDFMRAKPYGVRFERYVEKRSGEKRVRALLTVSEHPPLDFGLLVGESVYHLHGALDHLVYCLALLHKKRPRGTYFPLFLDETVYRSPPAPDKESPRDAALDGVHPDHRAILDEFQPYHDGSLAKANRLYVLRQFANADKHRVIQAGYGLPASIKVEPTEPGIDLDIRYPTLVPPVDEGAELFSVRWIDGYDDVPMHYEVKMTLAYGSVVPFVSRHYVVETAMRVQEVVSRVMDEVPELRA